jgi:hypothetical protein
VFPNEFLKYIIAGELVAPPLPPEALSIIALKMLKSKLAVSLGTET